MGSAVTKLTILVSGRKYLFGGFFNSVLVQRLLLKYFVQWGINFVGVVDPFFEQFRFRFRNYPGSV